MKNMGKIREFINRKNIRVYKCKRCGIVEVPFLRGTSIRDYGWEKIDGELLCNKCIRHPGIIDRACIQRHNKFVRMKVSNSGHTWFASHADFGIV